MDCKKLLEKFLNSKIPYSVLHTHSTDRSVFKKALFQYSFKETQHKLCNFFHYIDINTYARSHQMQQLINCTFADKRKIFFPCCGLWIYKDLLCTMCIKTASDRNQLFLSVEVITKKTCTFMRSHVHLK